MKAPGYRRVAGVVQRKIAVLKTNHVFVLADKETRSLWFPVTRDDCCVLVCIAGVHADRELKGFMNMERIEWSRWLSGFPASKFVHN